MKKWYKIETTFAPAGSEGRKKASLYVWVVYHDDALSKYQGLPVPGKDPSPKIRPLNYQEYLALRDAVKEAKVSASAVKEKYFTEVEDLKWWKR